MARLLYIEASPRKDRSASIDIAKAFIDAYKASHPGDIIDTIDLWKADLPSFDGDTVNAKYAILHGQAKTPAEENAWKAVERIIADFKSADKYLFSLPMWNFGIPYRLKHYIDILVQPAYTFSYSPKDGYKGMVTGKPVAIAYARGGSYPKGTSEMSYDFQMPYFQLILGFIGFTDIKQIVVEPMLMAEPGRKQDIMEVARKEARLIAQRF
jgi:FMN-dependent NADH-azoreductase